MLSTLSTLRVARPRPLLSLRGLSTTSASPPPPIRRVTDASPASLTPIVDTLSTAFDDFIMRALNGGDDPALRRARMHALAVHFVRDLECWVSSAPGSDGVDCVMLVRPPNVEEPTPNEEGEHTQEVERIIGDREELRRAGEEIKRIFEDMQRRAYGPEGDKGKYYVSHVGTAPRAAGHGLGGKMLRWMVQRGKEEKTEVTLLTMTEQHREYYERCGYHVRAEAPAVLNGMETRWWAMSDVPKSD